MNTKFQERAEKHNWLNEIRLNNICFDEEKADLFVMSTLFLFDNDSLILFLIRVFELHTAIKILYQMPEEDAFAVMVRLMQDFRLRELFKPSMAELGLCMYKLECLIQVRAGAFNFWVFFFALSFKRVFFYFGS